MDDIDLLQGLPDWSQSVETEVMKYAALGMSPNDIGLAMEWPRNKRRVFCWLADMPGSPVAEAIAMGRINGRTTPQIKLQESAYAGNIDAAKALVDIQAKNRLASIISQLDEDEFTFETVKD